MAMHHGNISSWHPPITTSVSANANTYSYDTENEDEEIDQLASDSDEVDELQAGEPATVTSTKTRSKPSSERVPGKSLIPYSRIENILESDGGSGHMSKEAMFVLSIATEEFIKRLAESGRRQANVARRATINYRDIASATQHLQEFNFLKDTIPEPMTLSHALSLREAKVKEIIETNPATSTPVTKPANTATPIPSIATLRPSPPVTTISETSSSAPARAKGKGRQSNASSKANGTAATNTGTGGTKRTRERKARQNATQAQTQNNGIVGVDDPQKNDQQSHSSNKASARENTTTTGETTRRRSSRANRDTTGGSGNASTPALTTAPATTHVNGVHRSIGPNGLGLHESPPRNSSHSSSYPHSYSADSWEGHRQDHHPTSPSHPYPYPDDHPSRNQHSHSPPAYHHGRETVLWGPGVQPPSGQAPSQRPHTHFTGPASGYLDDPSHRLLFDGRGGGMTGNPGRTIYSQQRAPNR